MLNFVAKDVQMYKIFKITRVSFLGHSVIICNRFLIKFIEKFGCLLLTNSTLCFNKKVHP